MFLHIDHDNLLEKYKTTSTMTEDLKNIELNVLPIYDDRYIKTKIKTYGHKVYTDFHGLNVPEHGVECESFIIISTDSLFVYEKKYYLQLYLENCACATIFRKLCLHIFLNYKQANERLS